MEAATAVKPTAKQSTVLGLLAQGKTASEIAKRMKITPNGVYGHMRRLKELGLLDENGAPVEAKATTKDTASSNGSGPKSEALSEVESLFTRGLEIANSRLGEIDARTQEIERERGELLAEAEALRSKIA